MPLIISERPVTKWEPVPPEGASHFCISIDSSYLSIAYDLSDGDRLKGKILTFKEGSEEFNELRGRDIEFILLNILNSDYLFISKKDWEELREYGLVRLGYYISVKIEEAIKKDGTKVPLYTKRDVEI